MKLFRSYFSNRKQIVEIGSAISKWIDILTGIPQGSILGPVTFNIFINDLMMFIEKTDICHFADDNTLYKSSPSLSVKLNCLEHDTTIVLNWFKVTSLKSNPPKFQFMFSGGKKSFQYKCKFEDTYIFSKDKVILLGITIRNKLTFEAHIEIFCKKASCTLWALQRIRKFLTVMQAKALASSFVNSQFNYCSIVWMFCRWKSKLRLENIS